MTVLFELGVAEEETTKLQAISAKAREEANATEARLEEAVRTAALRGWCPPRAGAPGGRGDRVAGPRRARLRDRKASFSACSLRKSI